MYEKIYKFPKRLKELRKNHGYNDQAQLGAVMDVSRYTVAKWEDEREINLPKGDELVRLAQMFGVSIDYLLGEIDFPTHEITDVCEYTGLSELAVVFLNDVKKECPEVCEVYSYLMEYDQKAFIDGLSMSLLKYIVNKRAYKRGINPQELREFSSGAEGVARLWHDIEQKESIPYLKWRACQAFENAIEEIEPKIRSYSLSGESSQIANKLKDRAKQMAEFVASEPLTKEEIEFYEQHEEEQKEAKELWQKQKAEE